MERDALAALVRSHQAQLFRYIRYLGVDRVRAEDLVQETFLVACRKGRALAKVKENRRAAWLRGVARRVFLEHYRRVRRNPVSVDPTYLERAENAWASEFLRGEDGSDYIEALRKCLERLSRQQRRAVDLRYAEEHSRSQMAQALGMTQDGVKSLLQRIRRSLADCIRGRLAQEET